MGLKLQWSNTEKNIPNQTTEAMENRNRRQCDRPARYLNERPLSKTRYCKEMEASVIYTTLINE